MFPLGVNDRLLCKIKIFNIFAITTMSVKEC